MVLNESHSYKAPLRISPHSIEFQDFLIQIFYQSGKNEEKELYITCLRTKRGQCIWRGLRTCSEHTAGNTLTLFELIASLGSRSRTDPRPGRPAAHSGASQPQLTAGPQRPPALLPAAPRSGGGGATDGAPCRPALEPRPAAERAVGNAEPQRSQKAARQNVGRKLAPASIFPHSSPFLFYFSLLKYRFFLQMELLYQTLMMSLPLCGPMERQSANHHQQPWIFAPLNPTNTSPKHCNLPSLCILTPQQGGAKDGKDRSSTILFSPYLLR